MKPKEHLDKVENSIQMKKRGSLKYPYNKQEEQEGSNRRKQRKLEEQQQYKAYL